jgi:hypothetical protein
MRPQSTGIGIEEYSSRALVGLNNNVVVLRGHPIRLTSRDNVMDGHTGPSRNQEAQQTLASEEHK